VGSPKVCLKARSPLYVFVWLAVSLGYFLRAWRACLLFLYAHTIHCSPPFYNFEMKLDGSEFALQSA
ncbi:uncharacterized protein DEA37_0000737, partial [Paragonimus westermani]